MIVKSKVMYFEKVYPAFKKLLELHNKELFDILYWEEVPRREKKRVLDEIDFFLVGPSKISGKIIKQTGNLKLIQKTGIGVDNIDLQIASELGVYVCNTPGANAAGVAELTIALILNLYRKINFLDKSTKSDNWLMWEHRLSSYEMKGKTQGFLGFGDIGKETAKLSKVFGTKIVYHDKNRLSEDMEKRLEATYMELNDLLKASDIVSIHLPLTPETKRLIGRKELSLMKTNAILINVSRGNIVDESALAEVIAKKLVAGAGIDVWEKEPVDKENPLLFFDNVIATPHIGAGTKDSLDRVLSMSFRNFILVEQNKTPKFIVSSV